MSKKIQAIMNGQETTLYGIEAEVYERGGESAVLARRKYLEDCEREEREIAHQKKCDRYYARNEKSTATHVSYYRDELED